MTQHIPPDPPGPSAARIWNYWLGGQDHVAADRAVADQVAALAPAMPQIARASRLFLLEVVRRLAAEHGIGQFLDIGSGIPAGQAIHEVARRSVPQARVVYVDRDPAVLAPTRARLSAAGGETDFVQADLRDTGTIFAAAARTLDFTRPVAILLMAVLHFVPERDQPSRIVTRLMNAVPAGSHLALTHLAADIAPGQVAEIARRYQEMTSLPMTPRSREEVARFFDGLEMVPPGLVPISQWPLPAPVDPAAGPLLGYCGLARKA